MSKRDTYFVVCSKLFLDLWTISRQTGTKRGISVPCNDFLYQYLAVYASSRPILGDHTGNALRTFSVVRYRLWPFKFVE